MNRISTTVLALFSFFFSYGQCTCEIKSKEIHEIKFDSSCVENYINNLSQVAVMVQKMEVQVNEAGTFLLIKGLFTNHETWVYAVPLKFTNNTVSFIKNEPIHACQMDDLKLENFLIENQKIVGCIRHNHKVTSH